MEVCEGGSSFEFLISIVIFQISFYQAGLFDKILTALRKRNHGFDINEADEQSGMTLLQFACAAGQLVSSSFSTLLKRSFKIVTNVLFCFVFDQELVVEILSQGGDANQTDIGKNTCLHFAALNNRKAIVEVLLRSGADPSIPNESGDLPVELTEDADLRLLFTRDRSNVFSPIVQARTIFAELLAQQQLHPNNNNNNNHHNTAVATNNSNNIMNYSLEK